MQNVSCEGQGIDYAVCVCVCVILQEQTRHSPHSSELTTSDRNQTRHG